MSHQSRHPDLDSQALAEYSSSSLLKSFSLPRKKRSGCCNAVVKAPGKAERGYMRKRNNSENELKGRVLGRVLAEELRAARGSKVDIVDSGNGKKDITDGSSVDDPPAN